MFPRREHGVLYGLSVLLVLCSLASGAMMPTPSAPAPTGAAAGAAAGAAMGAIAGPLAGVAAGAAVNTAVSPNTLDVPAFLKLIQEFSVEGKAVHKFRTCTGSPRVCKDDSQKVDFTLYVNNKDPSKPFVKGIVKSTVADGTRTRTLYNNTISNFQRAGKTGGYFTAGCDSDVDPPELKASETSVGSKFPKDIKELKNCQGCLQFLTTIWGDKYAIFVDALKKVKYVRSKDWEIEITTFQAGLKEFPAFKDINVSPCDPSKLPKPKENTPLEPSTKNVDEYLKSGVKQPRVSAAYKEANKLFAINSKPPGLAAVGGAVATTRTVFMEDRSRLRKHLAGGRLRALTSSWSSAPTYFESYDVPLDAAPRFAQVGAGCPAGSAGDGYCDAACNNKDNGWDGGDCCKGTCVDAKYPCGHGGFSCQTSLNKDCLFLHGLGQNGPATTAGKFAASYGPTQPPGNAILNAQTYWGDVGSELQGVCGKVIFGWANTNDFGYDDAVLQNSYYDNAKKVADAGGVVFAHSMANPILAGACWMQNKCVKWVMLAGPMRGSAAADASNALSKLFAIHKTNKGTKSLMHNYHGMMYATDNTANQLAKAVADKQLLIGALCGYSAWGSGGLSGAGLFAVRDIIWGTFYCSNFCTKWKGVESDGFVHMEECSLAEPGRWITGQEFKKDWRSDSFMFKGNHLDSTGSRGNQDHLYDFVRKQAKKPPPSKDGTRAAN